MPSETGGVSASVHSASPHESKLSLETVESCHTDDLPERLIGDKAYDGDALDAQMAACGAAARRTARWSVHDETRPQEVHAVCVEQAIEVLDLRLGKSVVQGVLHGRQVLGAA